MVLIYFVSCLIKNNFDSHSPSSLKKLFFFLHILLGSVLSEITFSGTNKRPSEEEEL